MATNADAGNDASRSTHTDAMVIENSGQEAYFHFQAAGRMDDRTLKEKLRGSTGRFCRRRGRHLFELPLLVSLPPSRLTDDDGDEELHRLHQTTIRKLE